MIPVYRQHSPLIAIGTRLLVRVSPEVRASIAGLLDSQFCAFCETEAEVMTVFARGPIHGIVWELSGRMPKNAEAIPEAIREASKYTPILLRAELTSANCREIAALSNAAVQLGLSLIPGGDDLIAAAATTISR